MCSVLILRYITSVREEESGSLRKYLNMSFLELFEPVEGGAYVTTPSSHQSSKARRLVAHIFLRT